MAREKKQEESSGGGCPAWLASYGDLVTLLLCFFVLLYAMSTIDAEKLQQLAASIPGSTAASLLEMSSAASSIVEFAGSGIMEMPRQMESSAKEVTEDIENYQASRAELAQMASDFETYFAQHNTQTQVQVQVDTFEEYVRLTFPDGILFDAGKANLRPDVLPILSMVAEELLKHPDSDIRIEGHTDSDPIGTMIYPDNWYLSAARAITVGKFFIDEKGLSPYRVAAEGRGEFIPVAPNDTAENKAKNRRVEIKIYSKYYSNTI